MRILDPQSMAILRSGLFRPADGFFLGALVLEALTVVQWRVFGQPTAEQLVVVLLATLLFCSLWLGLLVLRVGLLVLQVRGEIKLMPAAAAQLVEAYRLGSAPTAKKP